MNTLPSKLEAALIEMLIRYEPFKYFGPQKTAAEISNPATLGWGAGFGNSHDRYGRGNKWGKQKSFNDYRGAT